MFVYYMYFLAVAHKFDCFKEQNSYLLYTVVVYILL
jgi:hypothetical protein